MSDSSNKYANSIFWVELGKINPNPYQPRREFDELKLKDLADSIRQYGILQPLVVTREEVEKENGGISTRYELIAGERRLRASKIAGLYQVPVVIREGDADDERERMKLELAIIENVQREDLNPVDRAHAFRRLVDEFNFKHSHIARKIGKSREYVSNTMRLLALPQELIDAISQKKITEGHARPLLMLVDHPEEQSTLFKEILYKKLTVREAERIARHTAHEKVRKHSPELDPQILALEQKFIANLGTRVSIEHREVGGKLTIDFYSIDELHALFDRLQKSAQGDMKGGNSFEDTLDTQDAQDESTFSSEDEKRDEDLYSIKNFTV